MFYRSRAPAPPLADFVEYLWYLSDVPTHARERILPSGTLELVVNLDENEFRIYDLVNTERCRRFSGAIVSGAYRGFFVIDTLEHASIVGVHFRPGGAALFLGAPPGLLADDHVDLDALWGQQALEIRERLCAAENLDRRFDILENALLARFHTARPRHAAVRVALERLGRTGASVSDVAATVELSHRRFIEVFTAEVGMTPKLFGRVRRFQRTMAVAQRSASLDWSRVALECGYFDQSHMIRDFVAFSGFSPSALQRHYGVRVKENHVALPGSEGSNSSKMQASPLD